MMKHDPSHMCDQGMTHPMHAVICGMTWEVEHPKPIGATQPVKPRSSGQDCYADTRHLPCGLAHEITCMD